ncbi:MAG: hypothetical protein AB1728_15365 [Bacteroidota bacterium]
MEKARHSIQFEAEVDDEGKVTFSKSVNELQLAAGSKVTVTIFGGVVSKKLTTIGVTEEEIERIGKTQMEDREHVMTFLASQGTLKKRRIPKRLVRA